MKRCLDALGSLKLTLFLLVALGVLFVVGLAVPQKALLTRDLYEAWAAGSPTAVRILEATGLTDVYRSPLAVGLWSLFFLNLAVVMARRVPVTLERVRIDRAVPPPGAPGQVSAREVALPTGLSPAQVAGFLASSGLAVHVDGNRLRAVKHRFAPAATLVFHLSFFLVAGGGIASYVTRFQGTVDLGEGEEFTGSLEQYASPPRMPRLGSPPAVRFTVEEIAPEIVQNVPVSMRIKIRTPDFRPRFIEINRPYEAGHAAFVFKKLGVAPALVLRDAAGKILFAGYMRLDVLGGKVERFELLGHQLEARFFPEYFREGEQEGSRSQEMKDPVLRLAVTGPGGEQGVAALRPGEVMAVGPNTIEFPEWRYWVTLFVRAERGLPIVWLGFGIASLALVMRLWLYRREFIVEWSDDGDALRLRIAGRADYYRALFEDEVDALARRVERGVVAAPADAAA